jgi:hypothetical protein
VDLALPGVVTIDDRCRGSGAARHLSFAKLSCVTEHREKGEKGTDTEFDFHDRFQSFCLDNLERIQKPMVVTGKFHDALIEGREHPAFVNRQA